MKFKGKISIITGAAKGIGRATSITLGKEGSFVILADIDEENLKRTNKDLQDLGIESIALPLDIANLDNVNKFFSVVMKKYNRVDILINNAGLFSKTPILKMTEKEWDRVLNVNLKGTFFVSKAAIPSMINQRYGKIVNLSSLSAKRGGVTSGANYGASKAGIISITKYFARFCAPYGVNVNGVVPGFVDTDLMRIHSPIINEQNDNIPLGYVATCEEIANAISFLASDDSKYITGEILDVNGGLLMD